MNHGWISAIHTAMRISSAPCRPTERAFRASGRRRRVQWAMTPGADAAALGGGRSSALGLLLGGCVYYRPWRTSGGVRLLPRARPRGCATATARSCFVDITARGMFEDVLVRVETPIRQARANPSQSVSR